MFLLHPWSSQVPATTVLTAILRWKLVMGLLSLGNGHHGSLWAREATSHGPWRLWMCPTRNRCSLCSGLHRPRGRCHCWRAMEGIHADTPPHGQLTSTSSHWGAHWSSHSIWQWAKRHHIRWTCCAPYHLHSSLLMELKWSTETCVVCTQREKCVRAALQESWVCAHTHHKDVSTAQVPPIPWGLGMEECGSMQVGYYKSPHIIPPFFPQDAVCLVLQGWEACFS